MKGDDSKDASLSIRDAGKESGQEGFIERLRQLADRHGSANALARAAGISQSGLQRYLTGSDPSRKALIAIALACDVSIDWLAMGKEPPQKLTAEGVTKTAEKGGVRERPVMRVIGEDKQTLPKHSLEYIAHGEGELRLKPSSRSHRASPPPPELYAALVGPLADYTSGSDERKWVMLTALDIVRVATDGDREAMAQLEEDDLSHAVLLALHVRKIWLMREEEDESRKQLEEELRQLGDDFHS